MCHDGICAIRRVPPLREICWTRGMAADKRGWHLPSPCAGPAKAGKTQGTHMRSTAPQPSRPTFYPVPALRHGENGISFRPQPRKQPLSGCSPSRAAAALATLSPISPAAATGASGAWR